MNKIKKGDSVTVITGKNKGLSGKVLATVPSKNKVVVEGANIATIHKKARKQNEKSEIVKAEKAIDASNVMINCPTCNRPVRVRFEMVDGKKVRVCVKCGNVFADNVENKTAKKEPAKRARRTTKKETTVDAAETTEVKKPRAKRTAKTEEPKE